MTRCVSSLSKQAFIPDGTAAGAAENVSEKTKVSGLANLVIPNSYEVSSLLFGFLIKCKLQSLFLWSSAGAIYPEERKKKCWRWRSQYQGFQLGNTLIYSLQMFLIFLVNPAVASNISGVIFFNVSNT